MDCKMHRSLKSILLSKLEFENGELEVLINDGAGVVGSVRFEYPRAFRVFAESDGYNYLNNLEISETILEAEDTSGIFTSESSGFLEEYKKTTPNSRLDIRNYSCFVVTPDQCVEVIVFENPIMILR